MAIPKILHFCFGFSPSFGNKPWSMVHHVSVASAIDHIQPEAAYIYFEHLPQGPWWERSCRLATPVPTQAPREVFGNLINHPAHRADVVRLRKLLETGGIYLDVDVFVHKSFSPMLNETAVLGQQGPHGSQGVANAVILAEPGAEFISRWLDSYRTFRSRGRDEFWDEHSVKVPAILAARYPDTICVMPHHAFYWPLWHESHLKMIFGPEQPGIVGEQTFATHLWETHAWKFLEHLTPGQVRRTDSNFCQWARPYVSGLPDDFGAPELKEWLLTKSKQPRLTLENTFQKVMRGARITLRGRGSPRV